MLFYGIPQVQLDPAHLEGHLDLSGLVLLGLHPQAFVAAFAAACSFYRVSRIAAHAYLEVQDSVFCFWKSSHNNQLFVATYSDMKLCIFLAPGLGFSWRVSCAPSF